MRGGSVVSQRVAHMARYFDVTTQEYRTQALGGTSSDTLGRSSSSHDCPRSKSTTHLQQGPGEIAQQIPEEKGHQEPQKS